MSEPIAGSQPPYFCRRCPRLFGFLEECRDRLPRHFNGPVPSFGDRDAALLVVGLAPGLNGANKTGRPFTGDAAGDLLYPALAKFGFSNDRFDARIDDGLALRRAMITNAVRCVPPQNKPIGAEVNTCRDFLIGQIAALPHLKVLLCLGKIAHDSVVRGLGGKVAREKFAHGSEYELGGYTVLSSYHCSRYNTNTGRLTEAMFFEVFARARDLVEGQPSFCAAAHVRPRVLRRRR
ncbi:uracil-DNA glycosylase [uncultured Algimonas sp.]|uniref:uracil-DNA glycosylase n=1 Tax=uncultured Algimonas sp. TaxID=1547920 RepID=UPI00261A5D6F|nr:uracil-DNA glycosylase [uncultured Algimonas sp.]